MDHSYRIAILLHEDQVLLNYVDYEPVDCWNRDHPRYMEARAIDDQRCSGCRRKIPPPRLTVLPGGRRD